MRMTAFALLGASVAVLLYFAVAAHAGGPEYASGEWSYWWSRTEDAAKHVMTPIYDPVGGDEYAVLAVLLRESLESKAEPHLLASSTYWPPEDQGYLQELIDDRPAIRSDFLSKNRTSHAYRAGRLQLASDVESVPIGLLLTANGKDRFDSRYPAGNAVTIISRVAFDSDNEHALIYLERRNADSCFRSAYYLLQRSGTGWKVANAWETYS